MQTSIKTFSHEQIEALLTSENQPTYRVKQLNDWLYVKRARNFDEMTTFPLSMRKSFSSLASIDTLSIADKQVSKDGTRKYIFETSDHLLVETVGIPTQGEKNRLTVCVSSQIGCSMKCAFCATGSEGFSRNLGIGEIVDQVLLVQDDMQERVSNVVVMGQGEPFLNTETVIDALRILNNPRGIGIGARRITLSTCGIIPGILRFSEVSEQFTLAVSLHSANQKTRNLLMPKTAAFPLSNLKQALRSYIQKTDRRVTFEYLLIKGVNDSKAELALLKAFCTDLLCHVNLLRMNSISTSSYSGSSENTVRVWAKELNDAHIETSIRLSRGFDIDGACGQLKNTFSQRAKR